MKRIEFRAPEMDSELPMVVFAVVLVAAGALVAHYGMSGPRDLGDSKRMRTADAALPKASDFNTFFTQRIQ